MFNLKKSISLLKLIYPKYLVLLVLAPVLIGYIINFKVSDKLGLLINLLWLPVAAIPYYLFKKKIFYNLMVLFYFLIGFAEITHWLILKGPLTVASLFMVFNTNSIEFREFLSVRTTPLLLWLLPYCLIFIIALNKPPTVNNSLFKKLVIGFVIILTGFFLYLSKSAFIAEITPQFIRVSNTFVSDFRKYKKAVKNNKLKNIEARRTIDNEKQLFVLIIGESASRNHMSLYNYKIKTNPKLESRNDILIFNDVVSGYSNTIEGVMSLMSETNLENKLPFYNSKDLIDVFHSLGFKTYWISNQIPFGWAENLISAIGSKSDQTRFVNVSSNSTHEGNDHSSYDEKLFEPFYNALNEKENKKLIVLHLMGNHLSYDKRYPRSYEVFKGSDNKSKMIAEYDNSMLYNDFIVDSLFSMIEQNNLKTKDQVASAIYVSDHGENVYDVDDVLGHHFVDKLYKPNVEIPMIVWLSPEYIQLDKLKASLIEGRRGSAYVSDDMFHSILDLNFIESPVFNKTRSLFNNDFNANRLRVLTDGEDYDKN